MSQYVVLLITPTADAWIPDYLAGATNDPFLVEGKDDLALAGSIQKRCQSIQPV